MPFILDEDFQYLKQSLPTALQPFLQNDEIILVQAYPLLSMICKDRELLTKIKIALKIPDPPSGLELGKQLSTICQTLAAGFNQTPLFCYRLPIVLSEFPIHSRAINQAIKDFNALIERHYRDKAEFYLEEKSDSINTVDLAECYQIIIKAIQEHGVHCDAESLGQLLCMIAGWSHTSLIDLFKSATINQIATVSIEPQKPKANPTIYIKELAEAADIPTDNPFIQNYDTNFNGAGRLAHETHYLLNNAFGMKLGGHFDAQVKYAPRFIPLDELHALIRRQLSHVMHVPSSSSFQLWIETTLSQLGVQFIQRNEGYLSKDLLVNPFLSELISFLSPEKIQLVLQETLNYFITEEFKPSQSELAIIAHYLLELLQGFQSNPGQALGIGANWDGTVNQSNKAGAYAFKFIESATSWGKRFKQLSLHRQGPAEAKMNAAMGIKFEAQALLANFEYMSQLQASELNEVIYNALIDNLVSELFPAPAYFEHEAYQKYRKQYIARHSEYSTLQIDSYFESSHQGTYFKDRKGKYKQTPMYRRAGTLDVLAFPRNTTYSEQSRVCYAGNPLGPLQLQYAQAMHKSVRGHIVYNPIGPDQFLEDVFYGQVIRAENGDYLPFIGVIPKNFDKYFKQDNELCASFVIRMLQSSRIMEYCPTFKNAYEQLKTHFLPPIANQPPELPLFCPAFLFEKRQKLATMLADPQRSFIDCEQQFYSLFKNLIYNFYEYGQEDEHFKHSFLTYVNSQETFYPISKAQCEKIIRDLSINKPINVAADSLARYEAGLLYLRELTTFFYPKPTDDLAQEIAKQARRYVIPLAKSKGVNAYFKQQQHNKQANLSRKQTPGMLFSALKDGGPSKTIAQDYGRMHNYNFPSYYRDADGTPNGEPQTYERFLDWNAKKIGAGLQVMHKYHPLAVIHYPLSEPYLRAKQRMAEHPQQKVLWALEGGLEGFFWYGLIKGLWHTTSTPFYLLFDLLNFKSQQDISNNPLALPAAPANESSIKALEAAYSRDYLLKMLGKSGSSATKKMALIRYTQQLITDLYPYVTEQDSLICHQILKATFPLNDEELKNLFKPLLLPEDGVDLSAIIHQYNAYINRNLLQAVFHCITHPLFSTQSKVIIKEIKSFFGLSSKQNTVLLQLLQLYQHATVSYQKKFRLLFQFEGVIHQSLLIRDQYIQKIQNYILTAFNEEWLLDILFSAQLDKYMANLSPELLEITVAKLPLNLKRPLRKLLSTHNLQVLNDYSLLENQRTFLLKVYALYQNISPAEKEKMIQLSQIEKTNKILSIKDKAQQKWAKFAERELRHQMLSIDEVSAILLILSGQFPEIALKISELKSAYQNLNQEESVDRFYTLTDYIANYLRQLMLQHKKNSVKHIEAQTLIKNFLDIIMNALINSRLDKIDILGPIEPQNPLLSTKAFKFWLLNLAKNKQDLRSFIEQQVQQSPSLDHALWRCKCIMQVIECNTSNKKITKTGMQSLIRFWSQHKDNVTINGEKYISPQTGEPDKSTEALLFKDSPTMQYALARVQYKLPKFSIFRTPKLCPEKTWQADKEEHKYSEECNLSS